MSAVILCACRKRSVTFIPVLSEVFVMEGDDGEDEEIEVVDTVAVCEDCLHFAASVYHSIDSLATIAS